MRIRTQCVYYRHCATNPAEGGTCYQARIRAAADPAYPELPRGWGRAAISSSRDALGSLMGQPGPAGTLTDARSVAERIGGLVY